MRIYRLERRQYLAVSPDEVFAFFAEARNLEALTPPFLRFEVLTPEPIDLREGALIEYRLRLHGLPLRWRTRIESWNAPRAFVDRQLSGPYRLWHHRHEFEAAGAGTVMRDVVRYALPLGWLGRLAHLVLVRRDLRRIFDYREAVIAERFAG